MRMRGMLTLLASGLLACTDPDAPVAPPTPQARLVDAAAALTAAASAADRAGYRVLLTITTTDSQPPRVGVFVYPK